MYHFFVTPENIINGKVLIAGGDANHIKNVLRMKIGEELMISDGEGNDYLCKISAMDSDITCEIVSKDVSSGEPTVKFFLFQGLPKADKFEHIIQKSVELGVFEIIPVETERSIVKYDDKKQKAKIDRWQKIAEGAAKQSHRGIVPEVKPVMKLKNALKYAEKITAPEKPTVDNNVCDGGTLSDCRQRETCTINKNGIILIPYENYKDIGATKTLISGIQPGMNVCIFIGPEGGFAEKEVEEAMAFGAKPISLGNRILRTETAPLMLLSVLMFQMEE